jgi:ABC-type branched-subunit amino acid transport system substrate-binding protein/peptidoglycan hydrolase-like protein with peptidoglycan-binding domain
MVRHRVRGRGRSIAAALVVVPLSISACDDDSPSAGGTDVSGATTSVPSTTSPDDAPGPSVAPTATEPAAEAAFTFGYLAPGVGLLNALAIGQERGLTLAVDEINAGGGVLGGPVTVVTAEESSDRPVDAALDDLLAQEPDVIVGPVGSASAATLVPVLAERSLLACSASATATSLTADAETGDESVPSFARTALRDDHYARAVADELMATDDESAPAPATVMIVGRDDVYGNELTAALSAELSARGADVSTLTYAPRRVDFPEEAAAVVSADPDVVVLAAFAEAPRLIARIVEAGYAADGIVGLDGLLVPRLAEQTFPSDPGRADGLRVLGTTGDRALMARLSEVPAVDDQVSYGPQMYDCVITLALAAIAAGSTEPATIAQQLTAVTSDGRACSTFAHCVELLAAGEDIDYDGTTGHIAFDTAGDVSTARLVTAAVTEGLLQPVQARDLDLVAEQREEIFASAVFVAQLQQALKILGYYEGDVTGVFDEATAAAVAALQRDLGLPETGEFDAATEAALRERLGGQLDAFTGAVSDLQQALAELGFYDGPIDGRYSDATIAAVRAFQRDLGVPETGIIDVATLRAIYARGRATAAAATTTTTAPPPPPPPTTATTSPPAPAATTTAPPPATTTTAAPPPPATTTPSPPPTTTPPPPPEGPSLYEVLSGDPDFSTLIDVADAAGYGTDLSQPLPVTLFAPTNEAFGALDPERLEELRTDAAAADALLRDLAVETAIPSDELTSGAITTIGGSSAQVDVDEGTITFGGATVVRPDITASNGIAHGIDAVPDS